MNVFKSTILFSILIIALLLGCSSGDKSDSNSSAQSQSYAAPKTESSPIQFTAYDIDGTLHKSKEWIGKQPVVINFWGTWCPPCRHEVPDLVRLYNEYSKKGVEIIGLAVKDRSEKVRSFAQQYNMSWPMLLADDNILISYNAIQGIPTTIFLDRNGNEVTRFVGMQSYDVFKQAFDKII